MNTGGQIEFTPTQRQRLRELGAATSDVERRFGAEAARDAAFRERHEALVRSGREHLQAVRNERRRAGLIDLGERLTAALTDEGFVAVTTPQIINAEALDKMGLGHGHPLREQVFWLADGRCLRPMLAPNLYVLMRRLGRLWRRPFGIFEIGSCFRRESHGSRHLEEFTMLNLVEVGGHEQSAGERLERLTALVMAAAEIADYRLRKTTSEVYGEMLDVEINGLEVCSAARGPHPLDDNWGIFDPWVGLGFGLERLLLAASGGDAAIERFARSTSYLDGVRLNL